MRRPGGRVRGGRSAAVAALPVLLTVPLTLAAATPSATPKATAKGTPKATVPVQPQPPAIPLPAAPRPGPPGLPGEPSAPADPAALGAEGAGLHRGVGGQPGRGVTVAVVDSGVDYHPAAGRQVTAMDLTGPARGLRGSRHRGGRIIAASDTRARACRSAAWRRPPDHVGEGEQPGHGALDHPGPGHPRRGLPRRDRSSTSRVQTAQHARAAGGRGHSRRARTRSWSPRPATTEPRAAGVPSIPRATRVCSRWGRWTATGGWPRSRPAPAVAVTAPGRERGQCLAAGLQRGESTARASRRRSCPGWRRWCAPATRGSARPRWWPGSRPPRTARAGPGTGSGLVNPLQAVTALLVPARRGAGPAAGRLGVPVPPPDRRPRPGSPGRSALSIAGGDGRGRPPLVIAAATVIRPGPAGGGRRPAGGR